jgi:peptidoglycan/xylan/chitin deacetylase (PgdA/CDA1 family)
VSPRLLIRAEAKSTPIPAFTPAPCGTLRRRDTNTACAFVEPHLGHDFGRVPVHTAAPAMVQPKLTIGQPGDKHEQEADREEEEAIQAKSAEGAQLQRQGEELEEEEEKPRQAKQAGGQTPHVSRGLEAQIHSMEGSGQPLSGATRDFFESRFGCDFSCVRVHNDSRTAQTAQAMNSEAFTIGQDVFFGAGQYLPGTLAGKRLLAHELTHVVQQKRMGGTRIQRKGSRLRDFEKTDASKLSDDEIIRTREYRAFRNPDWIWQKDLKVTKEEALLACRLILGAIQAGKDFTWEEDARDFVLAAREQLSAATKSEGEKTKPEKDKKKLEPPKEKKGAKTKKPKTEKVGKELAKEERKAKSKTKESRPKKPEFVKFTFDDGPRSRHTDSILKTLGSTKAGFFVNGPGKSGNWTAIEKVPTIIGAGHIVGNHTWNHSHNPKMFKKLHDYISKKYGYSMKYWRGPGGDKKGLTKIAAELDYGPHTHWEFNSLDTKGLTAKQIVENQIMKGERGRGPKGVLLMHDHRVAKILPALVKELTKRSIAIRNFP